ncbi:hypothetical protein ACFYU5_09835 [Nocardia aobensis]|uniref:Short-chain dehydrogenase n=1 Tax=Nocardia aobensis TaxID=257277 RepID=A0ABW6NZT7_9NOCA
MSVPNIVAGKAILVTGAGRGLGRAEGREEIFPDPMSPSLATGWDDGVVESLERANAVAVQAVAVAS